MRSTGLWYRSGNPPTARLDEVGRDDHVDHEALVALPSPTSTAIIGVARDIRQQRPPDEADVAVTVADHWQDRGLATVLLQLLADRARAQGIRRLTADTLLPTTPRSTPSSAGPAAGSTSPTAV